MSKLSANPIGSVHLNPPKIGLLVTTTVAQPPLFLAWVTVTAPTYWSPCPHPWALCPLLSAAELSVNRNQLTACGPFSIHQNPTISQCPPSPSACWTLPPIFQPLTPWLLPFQPCRCPCWFLNTQNMSLPQAWVPAAPTTWDVLPPLSALLTAFSLESLQVSPL